MTRLGRMWVAVLVLAVLAGTAMSAGAPAKYIAKITKMSGDVRVVRIGAIEFRPQLVGRVIKRGALMSKDEIHTGANGSATVVFNDGSKMEIGPGAKVSLAEMVLARRVRGTAVGQERRIGISLGKVVWDVRRNETMRTKFELPNGVAAVRGTGGAFNVQMVGAQIQVTMTLTEGGLQFSANLVLPGGAVRVMTMTMTAGQNAGYQVIGGKLQVTALPGSGPLTITLPNGSKLTIPAGSQMELRVGDDGKVYVRATKGTITMTNRDGGTKTLVEGGGEEEGGDVMPGEGDQGQPPDPPNPPDPCAHS